MYNPAYVKIRKELILLVHNIIVLKPAELKQKLISLVKLLEEVKAEEPSDKEGNVEVETRSVQEVAEEAEKNKRKRNSKKGQDE